MKRGLPLPADLSETTVVQATSVKKNIPPPQHVDIPINGGFSNKKISCGDFTATLQCPPLPQRFDVSKHSQTPMFSSSHLFSFEDSSLKEKFLGELHHALDHSLIGASVFDNFNLKGKSLFSFPPNRLQRVVSSTTDLTGESGGDHSKACLDGTKIPYIPPVQGYPNLAPCIQLMVMALQEAMGDHFVMDTVTLVWFNPNAGPFERQAFHHDWKHEKGDYPFPHHRVAVMMSCSDDFKLHFLPNFTIPSPDQPISTVDLISNWGPIVDMSCGFGGIMGFLDTTAHAGAGKSGQVTYVDLYGVRIHVYGTFTGGQTATPSNDQNQVNSFFIETMTQKK